VRRVLLVGELQLVLRLHQDHRIEHPLELGRRDAGSRRLSLLPSRRADATLGARACLAERRRTKRDHYDAHYHK
jgi:hypothetical protein